MFLHGIFTRLGHMQNEQTINTAQPALDLVWGAEAIAKVIGQTVRATFRLLDGGHLPARKVGGRWVASRSELARAFQAAEIKI